MFSKLAKLLFTPKYGGNVWSEYRLHTADRYVSKVTPFYGKKIKIPDAASYIACRNEVFREETYKFIASSSQPVIIDCGANVGLSVIYFKKLYPHAQIEAYEADPDIFDTLKYNVGLFGMGDVQLENKAIWTHNDGVDFSSEGGMSGHIEQEISDGRLIKIPSIALSDVLAKHDKIDFLKIDIEGAENTVLPTISGNLDHVNHVFIEYHSILSESQRLDELLSLLSRANFRYHIKEAYTRDFPFISKANQTNMDLQLNIFAINENH